MWVISARRLAMLSAAECDVAAGQRLAGADVGSQSAAPQVFDDWQRALIRNVRYSFSRRPIDLDRTQDLRAHYVFDSSCRCLSDVAELLFARVARGV